MGRPRTLDSMGPGPSRSSSMPPRPVGSEPIGIPGGHHGQHPDRGTPTPGTPHGGGSDGEPVIMHPAHRAPGMPLGALNNGSPMNSPRFVRPPSSMSGPPPRHRGPPPWGPHHRPGFRPPPFDPRGMPGGPRRPPLGPRKYSPGGPGPPPWGPRGPPPGHPRGPPYMRPLGPRGPYPPGGRGGGARPHFPTHSAPHSPISSPRTGPHHHLVGAASGPASMGMVNSNNQSYLCDGPGGNSPSPPASLPPMHEDYGEFLQRQNSTPGFDPW